MVHYKYDSATCSFTSNYILDIFPHLYKFHKCLSKRWSYFPPIVFQKRRITISRSLQSLSDYEKLSLWLNFEQKIVVWERHSSLKPPQSIVRDACWGYLLELIKRGQRSLSQHSLVFTAGGKNLISILRLCKETFQRSFNKQQSSNFVKPYIQSDRMNDNKKYFLMLCMVLWFGIKFLVKASGVGQQMLHVK